jgi:hypothetical protein
MKNRAWSSATRNHWGCISNKSWAQSKKSDVLSVAQCFCVLLYVKSHVYAESRTGYVHRWNPIPWNRGADMGYTVEMGKKKLRQTVTFLSASLTLNQNDHHTFSYRRV